MLAQILSAKNTLSTRIGQQASKVMILDFTPLSTVTTILAVAGLIYGLFKDRENQILKRQEIIFPLMREFDENKKIYYAKELIDNVAILLKRDNEVIAEMPIKLKYCDEVLEYKTDDSILLTREPDDVRTSGLTQDEIVIRTIFDALLNFFGKLGYLIDSNIITKKELGYFLYYIEKAKKNCAVIKFARNLDYELFAILLNRIGDIPPDLKCLEKKYNKRLKQKKYHISS